MIRVHKRQKLLYGEAIWCIMVIMDAYHGCISFVQHDLQLGIVPSIMQTASPCCRLLHQDHCKTVYASPDGFKKTSGNPQCITDRKAWESLNWHRCHPSTWQQLTRCQLTSLTKLLTSVQCTYSWLQNEHTLHTSAHDCIWPSVKLLSLLLQLQTSCKLVRQDYEMHMRFCWHGHMSLLLGPVKHSELDIPLPCYTCSYMAICKPCCRLSNCFCTQLGAR